MSRSPQLYPEDPQDIFVAIPPPLVPPLARQLSSSQHGISGGNNINNNNSNNPQLVTPTGSSDNSFEQWTSFEPLFLQQQQLQLQLLLGNGSSDRIGANELQGIGSVGLAGNSTSEDNRLRQSTSDHSRTTVDNSIPYTGDNINASNNALPPPPPGSAATTMTTNRANTNGSFPLNTPVSSPPLPPPISLPAQLLNRLYPYPAMSTGSADSSCASSSGSFHSRINNNLLSGIEGLGGGFGSRSTSALLQQQNQPDLTARRNSTELARTAAATAIVNTLVNRSASGSSPGEAARIGLSIPRGDSPYIPSSLSMLFSDPEIMRVQAEVDQHYEQQQQQADVQAQRTIASNSQLTFSHLGSGVGSGIFEASEDDHESNAADGRDDAMYGEESRLLQETNHSDSDNEGSHILATRAGTGINGEDNTEGEYGYEVVQENQSEEDLFRSYVTMMAREDYIAPHEPSSSSPLFPSPLTSIGFTSGTSMLDVPEDQQRQAAGRIWRDYGTMMEQGARSGSGPFRNQQHTPTARSHAAYYHAVSNYHYSYNSNPNEDQGSSSRAGGGSSSQVNRCAPIGHYAVPDNWQWRRQRGRVMSQQSYGSGNGNFSGAGNGARRGHGEGREDHWLWGILVSVVSCWVCCESPAACCSSCCL